MSDPNLISISPAVREAFAPILQAVARARRDLAGEKDVAAVRPDTIPGGRPAAAGPGRRRHAGRAPGRRSRPRKEIQRSGRRHGRDRRGAGGEAVRGRACIIRNPGRPGCIAFENLISGEEVVQFAPPKSGSYEPLDPPNLPLVEEPMELTVCVSPEAGWSELEDFLGGTQKRLTVAMYQFTAPHIFDPVNAAVSPKGRRFELVLHPIPEKPAHSGVKARESDENSGVLDPLEQTLKARFEMAWATLVSKAHPDGLRASAYHIKVAVRDGNACWMSSGNWQSSNQPNVHP
jgi:hypothetical protein